jgi:outer membrane protein assembly factor BamA
MTERLIETDMGLKFPAEVDVDDIEKGIDLVYGSGFFERVGYRLDGYPDSTVVHLRVVEKSQNLFRVGLRFDTRTKGSVRINTTFRNLLLHGSTLNLDARFASDYEFEVRHALHIGLIRSLGVQTRLNTSKFTFDIFDGKNQVGTYRSEHTFAQLLLGSVFSNTLAVVGGLRPEYIDSKPTVGNPLLSGSIDKQMPILLRSVDLSDERCVHPSVG